MSAEPSDADINAWIERNWPKSTSDQMCRYCGQPTAALIPLGYGPRPKIWVHWQCSDPMRAKMRAAAIAALAKEECPAE
jgi:hypothetical protein